MLLLLAGCTPPPADLSVRGLVTEVEAETIAHARSVTILADDGHTMTFRVADSVEFTPGHLRQHQVFREPVLVTYRSAGNSLLAVQIGDGAAH
ncbi:MAG: hypothetical protein IT307_14890 [Chloroflexi bacterium]|nr:hypothetical protein [Chloroflexota bacterium]